MSHKLFSITSVALAACLAAAPAFATTLGVDGQQKSVEVSYADLDLATPADVAVLMGRIETAARNVCGPAPAPKQINESQAYSQCTAAAVSMAVARSGIPQLTKAYADKGGAGGIQVAER